ncbi:hypothetical protein TURU_005418 [Turdus rufiventris]|nr:hypothetical protein TURU_005418 [Turdus rufiventris]
MACLGSSSAEKALGLAATKGSSTHHYSSKRHNQEMEERHGSPLIRYFSDNTKIRYRVIGLGSPLQDSQLPNWGEPSTGPPGCSGPEHLHSEVILMHTAASAWRREGFKSTSEQPSSAYREVTDSEESGCVMT